MTARHGPTILAGGGHAWAQCTCGWRSAEYRSRRAASLAWARHIASGNSPRQLMHEQMQA